MENQDQHLPAPKRNRSKRGKLSPVTPENVRDRVEMAQAEIQSLRERLAALEQELLELTEIEQNKEKLDPPSKIM